MFRVVLVCVAEVHVDAFCAHSVVELDFAVTVEVCLPGRAGRVTPPCVMVARALP